MSQPESRTALPRQKRERAHPAVPEQSQTAASNGGSEDTLVQMSVRVRQSIRRRLRLASARDEESIQEIIDSALENELQRRGA